MSTLISFKKGEIDLKDYLYSKRDKSAFIKDLLQEQMEKDIKDGKYIPKNNKK